MKNDKTSLAGIIGASIVTSLSAGAVNAGENPFALKELGNGYALVAEAAQDQAKGKKEATCGEGKCGAEMMKQSEMKCGAGMKKEMKAQDQKAVEGKCAGAKKDGASPSPQPK